MTAFSPKTVSSIAEDEVEELKINSWPVLEASRKAQRTINPIRAIVDPILNLQQATKNQHKLSFVSLALGDPTTSLAPCPVALEAVSRLAAETVGYVSACGTPEARRAVAAYHNATSEDDVIVANGCSGALELALTALLESDESSVLLVPRPGFPLYQVIAESHGASVAHYRLKLSAQGEWQIDLDDLRDVVAGQKHPRKVAGLVITNPGNPTGAVFSAHHLREICAVCTQFQIPVVADEIYGDLVFHDSRSFVPMASIAADYQVPVITASGLGKQYLVPGWRVGWIVFHDNMYGTLGKVHAGALQLAQVILGASHLAQAVVPALLSSSTQPWAAELRATLRCHAEVLCLHLQRAPGLTVVPPTGAMYAMVKIDNEDDQNSNDVKFCEDLLKEMNVFCLPGSCFGLKSHFRIVFCAPTYILEEAADRIVRFCENRFLGGSQGKNPDTT